MLIAENIKGYDKLKMNQAMFKQFLDNFYHRWGIDARETIEPISVRYVKDKANGAYLRFDYMMDGKACWLHVKSADLWF